MQIINVTRDYIFSATCTWEILQEICTGPVAQGKLAQSQEWVEKLAKQPLKGGSGGNGSPKQQGVNDLPQAKLRTIVVQKYQDSSDFGATFREGKLQVEINCLPDLDIGKAGSAKRSTGARNASTTLVGKYAIDKGNGCKAPKDSPKHKVYDILFANNDFSVYLQKCHEAGLDKVVIAGRKQDHIVITKEEFARWALKCKWIKQVA